MKFVNEHHSGYVSYNASGERTREQRYLIPSTQNDTGIVEIYIPLNFLCLLRKDTGGKYNEIIPPDNPASKNFRRYSFINAFSIWLFGKRVNI
jgi:hypothetical protein